MTSLSCNFSANRVTLYRHVCWSIWPTEFGHWPTCMSYSSKMGNQWTNHRKSFWIKDKPCSHIQTSHVSLAQMGKHLCAHLPSTKSFPTAWLVNEEPEPPMQYKKQQKLFHMVNAWAWPDKQSWFRREYWTKVILSQPELTFFSKVHWDKSKAQIMTLQEQHWDVQAWASFEKIPHKGSQFSTFISTCACFVKRGTLKKWPQ